MIFFFFFFFFFDDPDSSKDNVTCQSSDGPAESVHVCRLVFASGRAVYIYKKYAWIRLRMLLIAVPQ